MRPELFVFDCDGTLIDTETIFAETSMAAIHELGLTDWTLDRYVDVFVGRPFHVGLGDLETAYGKALPKGFGEDIDALAHARFDAELAPLAGVVEALDATPGPRCVASSTALPRLRTNLATAGLLEAFDPHIFSASQVQRGKPFPDVFLFAAQHMQIEPHQAIAVEDSVPGVEAARAAGMTAVGYIGTAHDQDRMRARLMAAGASIIMSHWDEWPDTLCKLSS
jgi:HAD superfamily hydrolase (TIGR01509 family)